MALILVVDDDEPLRGIVAYVLEQEGYEVLMAPDGTQALSLARERLPDLVLCDIMMSGVDGFGVLASMRRDPLTAIIPLIFLTGVEGPSAVRKGMNLGADDYLTKPVHREALLAAVAARLARHADARRETKRRLEDLRMNTARALPHEFLTPLTAVLGLSSLLVDDAASFDVRAVKEIAEGILLGGRQLQALIGKFSLHVELEASLPAEPATDGRVPHAPCTLVAEAARAKAALLDRERDLDLAVEDGSTIAIHPDHLRALIDELVENALAFSDRGSAVSVHGAPAASGGSYRITVVDHGLGMSTEQLRGLETYVPTRRHRLEPGMGLGLAIVRRIVHRAGGEITFESRSEHGTTVLVRLPLHDKIPERSI